MYNPAVLSEPPSFRNMLAALRCIPNSAQSPEHTFRKVRMARMPNNTQYVRRAVQAAAYKPKTPALAAQSFFLALFLGVL